MQIHFPLISLNEDERMSLKFNNFTLFPNKNPEIVMLLTSKSLKFLSNDVKYE